MEEEEEGEDVEEESEGTVELLPGGAGLAVQLRHARAAREALISRRFSR